MSGWLIVSYVLLWLLALLLTLGFWALARQVGLLHRRVGPAGARMERDGPEIGDRVPPLSGIDLNGRAVHFGGPRDRSTVLLFTSPSCSACDDVAPAFRSLVASERGEADLIMISISGEETANRNFVRRFGLEAIPLVVSPGLAENLKVYSPPYAVALDRDGVVRAKGLVNHLEHLESLFNALQSGHPTLESWFEAQEGSPGGSAGRMAAGERR